MTIPDTLERNADYMHLYRALALVCTEVERKQFDQLIALAFTAGEAKGMAKALAMIQGMAA